MPNLDELHECDHIGRNVWFTWGTKQRLPRLNAGTMILETDEGNVI